MIRHRHRLDAGGVELSVLELGIPAGPPLVMLHGMRDVAWSLLPVAERFASDYRVLLPELRGHGESGKTTGYAMDQFVHDLYRVTESLQAGPAALFGQSLGGHIVARYAALFPERARAAVIVEGLGPPRRPGEDDVRARLQRHAQQLLHTLGAPQKQRALPSVEFATERLRANNVRLPPARAHTIAERATERNADGDLIWAFDPRVAGVFLGVHRDDSEDHWRNVRCPVCIVSGGLAAEYWRTQMPMEWDGAFAEGELEARIALFPDVAHVHFPDAGHMIHYDDPERLAQVAADFLEKRL